MKTVCLFAALVVLVLVGCGGEDELDAGDRAPGISVEQAVDAEGPAVVNGSLLAQGEDVRLCAALAESFPPQCGGASITVVGLDLAQIDGLTTEGDVAWSDLPIRVEGVLGDGILTVNENALE